MTMNESMTSMSHAFSLNLPMNRNVPVQVGFLMSLQWFFENF